MGKNRNNTLKQEAVRPIPLDKNRYEQEWNDYLEEKHFQ